MGWPDTPCPCTTEPLQLCPPMSSSRYALLHCLISDVLGGACLAVTSLFLLQMFSIYVKRAAEAFGITHTREIYEKAIEVLPDEGARLGLSLVYLCPPPPLPPSPCHFFPSLHNLPPPFFLPPGTCVCGMLSWRPNWGRWTELAPSTAMAHNSVIPGYRD